MNNNVFAVNNNIIKLIKKDDMSGMVLCYLLSNSNSNNICRTTFKKIIEENGYIPRSGTNQNIINNKIKNTLRLLISKGYITWITNPYKPNDKLPLGFDKLNINDELWFEISQVYDRYMLFNIDNYYKIINICLKNKKIKTNMAISFYLYILKHINAKEENGKCSVGYDNFVEDLATSKNTVSKYTKMLVDNGLLFKKTGNTIFTNEYYLQPYLTTYGGGGKNKKNEKNKEK